MKSKVIMTGFTQGTSAAKITKLEDEVEVVAGKLARDVNLFGEGGSDT